MKLLKDILFVLFIEFIYSFFTIYVVLCYKIHKKTRSIIYAHWLKYDPNRFYKFVGFNFKHNIFKSLYFYNNFICVYDNYKPVPICYQKDYEILPDKKSFLHTLKYIFYYYFVYIFLDDVNNVNGINSKVLLNKKYFKDINNLKIKNIKLVKSIFSEEYWLEDYNYSLDVIKFFISKSYTYNYLRDKATNVNNVEGKYFGYKYDVEYDKNVLSIFKVVLIRRQ